MSNDPDRIILGGTVLTVTGVAAEAVAVTGERITVVGKREDVLATRGPNTEIVDLRGATLVPGLIEPHTHPEISAQLYSWVDVSGFTYDRVAGVESAMRGAIAKAAPVEWVFAFGMDPMLTPDLGTWNRDRLDQMAPNNPVVIMMSWGRGWRVSRCRTRILKAPPDKSRRKIHASTYTRGSRRPVRRRRECR